MKTDFFSFSPQFRVANYLKFKKIIENLIGNRIKETQFSTEMKVTPVFAISKC